MTSSLSYQYIEAAGAVRAKIETDIDLFIIAGSGFKESLPTLEGLIAIPMTDVPYLPAPKVLGHGAELRFGCLDGKRVLVATGRVHLYEGYDAQKVAFAVRMAHQLKARGVVLTNAAGSVDHKYPAGTLSVIKDQINLTGTNCEANAAAGKVAFTDMSNCYDSSWRSRLIKLQQLPESVYCGLTGPSYETSAEARMLAILGANTVGMSTVQECIAARALGMSVLGLSLVTNMAGGLGGAITHDEVLLAAKNQRDIVAKALIHAISSAQT